MRPISGSRSNPISMITTSFISDRWACRARALLHLNTIPERFGLVLVEANAAGVPVIAMNLGSCREVIKNGQTGFLVDNVTEAVRALGRISEIDRRACRSRVRQYFSIDTMVE